VPGVGIVYLAPPVLELSHLQTGLCWGWRWLWVLEINCTWLKLQFLLFSQFLNMLVVLWGVVVSCNLMSFPIINTIRKDWEPCTHVVLKHVKDFGVGIWSSLWCKSLIEKVLVKSLPMCPDCLNSIAIHRSLTLVFNVPYYGVICI